MRKSFAKMFAGPAMFLGIAGALGAAVFTAPVVADDAEDVAVEPQTVVPMSAMASTVEIGSTVIGAKAVASSEEGITAHLTIAVENTGDEDASLNGTLVLYAMREMPGSRMGGSMEVMEERKIEVSLKAGELQNLAVDFPGVSDPFTSCMVFFVPADGDGEQSQLIGFTPIDLSAEAANAPNQPDVEG